jgi:hypothetical protein
MNRRTLLRWLVSGAAVWPLRGIQLHAQAAALSRSGVATLRAIAPAVLPSELGAAGHDKVVSDFVQWLASYRSGADRNWGYGHPRRNVSPTIAVTTYDAQLAALDDAAKAGAGELSTLPLDVRRTIVAARLDAIGARTLPGAPNGTHIVTDLLAFYYGSTAAGDLIYRARIGRGTCRGLAGAASKPTSIAGD